MWARAQVAHATNDLAAEHARRGLKGRFTALSTFIHRESEFGEFAGLAPQLGMTATALTSAVARMRDRHRLLVRGLLRTRRR